MWPAMPAEFAFFEREFGFAEGHQPEQGTAAFCREYRNGQDLMISFNQDRSIQVCIQLARRPVLALRAERLSHGVFQSWSGEQVLRISFDNEDEMRIHFDPWPAVFFRM